MKKSGLLIVLSLLLMVAAPAGAKEKKTIFLKKDAQVGVLAGVESITTKKYEWETKGNAVIFEIKKCLDCPRRVAEFLKRNDLDIPIQSIAYIQDDK